MKKDGAIVHQESKTFESERLAQDWADRLEAKLTKDGLPSRQLDATTLGQLLTNYSDYRAGIKPLRRTAVHELDQLARAFGSVRLSAVTSETFTSNRPTCWRN